MSDPETITLPRSGAALRMNDRGDAWKLIGDPRFLVDRVTQGGVTAYGWGVPGELDFSRATIDEAASRLDAHILSLRAAIMPADARERIAAAVVDSLRLVQTQAPCECPDDDDRPYADQCGPCRQGPQFVADAVLRALGGEVTT